MEKGQINICIHGPRTEMAALAEQLEADQPFEEMEIELLGAKSSVSVYITGGYARETDELVEAWTKEGWDVLADAHVWGWGPQSLHRYDGKEWYDYEFEDIDLDNMDPICDNLVGVYGVEDDIRECQEII